MALDESPGLFPVLAPLERNEGCFLFIVIFVTIK